MSSADSATDSRVDSDFGAGAGGVGVTGVTYISICQSPYERSR